MSSGLANRHKQKEDLLLWGISSVMTEHLPMMLIFAYRRISNCMCL